MARKVPPLPGHPETCWCPDCKRAYQKAYQSGYTPPRKYDRHSTCIDCGEKCNQRAERCRKCSAKHRARSKQATLRLCACGATLNGKKSSTICRNCYLASVTKIERSKRTCDHCHRSWLSRNSDARYCSGRCEREARLGLLAFIRPPESTPRGERGTCRHCGTTCEKFVCAECTRKVRKLHSRIYKNRKRGAEVVEHYDRWEIAVRDGWVCHLCTGHVSPHLWGTIEPDAPVLDHVIPISRGGPDTAENVKLAHRVCNGRKGNRLEGEHAGTRTKRESRPSHAQAA